MYKKEDLYNNARLIQAALQPTSNISLMAYQDHCKGSNCVIKLTSFHTVPIEIIGTSSSLKYYTALDSTKLVYSNRNSDRLVEEYTDLNVPKDHNYVHWKVSGIAGQYYTQIKGWGIPQVQPNSLVDPTVESIPFTR